MTEHYVVFYGDGSYTFFATRAEAVQAAQKTIKEMREAEGNEWSPYADDICVAKVIFKTEFVPCSYDAEAEECILVKVEG